MNINILIFLFINETYMNIIVFGLQIKLSIHQF